MEVAYTVSSEKAREKVGKGKGTEVKVGWGCEESRNG